MLKHFYILSLIFMSGMTAYSVVLNLSVKTLREQRLYHWLFTAMSLLVVPYLWVLALMLSSASVTDYLLLNRMGSLLYLFFLALLPLFFAEYSAVSMPKPLLAGLYAVIALLILKLFSKPLSGALTEVPGIEQVVMPWGEKLFRVRGVNNIWPGLAYLITAVITGFGIYSLWLKFRRDRQRTSLLIIFASVMFLAMGATGMLYRSGIGQFPPLGPVGFIFLLVVMGLSMNYEIRKELECHRGHLEEKSEELSAIYENAPLLMMIVDAAGLVQKINTTSTISTVAASEALGQRIGNVVRCAYAPQGCGTTPTCTDCVIVDCLHNTIVSGTDHQQVETRLHTVKDGKLSQSTFLLYTKKLSFRNRAATLVCLLDISERQHLREQIRKVEQQERSRLCRDLHDGVGQTLQAIRLQLKLLERRKAAPSPSGAELAAITQELDDAAGELREIAHALHPAYLNSVTLQQALQKRCDRLSQRGIPIVCDLADDTALLPHRVNENLFRIAQELLTNAVRHAGASEILISLKRAGDAVTLCIKDDGCGIGEDESIGAGKGLENIRERAALIGASLRIASDAGGTCVTVEVPAP
jgi:signal transduction histidine kinase